MHSELYDEYMRSDAWKDKCEQRKKLDGYRCCVCGRPELICREGLQIHHLNYDNVGEENIFTDIVSLCGTCHKKLHRGDPDIMRKAQAAIYKR